MGLASWPWKISLKYSLLVSHGRGGGLWRDFVNLSLHSSFRFVSKHFHHQNMLLFLNILFLKVSGTIVPRLSPPPSSDVHAFVLYNIGTVRLNFRIPLHVNWMSRIRRVNYWFNLSRWEIFDSSKTRTVEPSVQGELTLRQYTAVWILRSTRPPPR